MRVFCSLFFFFSPSHLFNLTRLFWDQMQPLAHLQSLASEGFINTFTDPSHRRNHSRSLWIILSFWWQILSRQQLKNNYQVFTYLSVSPSRLYYFPFLDLLWKYHIKWYQAVNKTLWTIFFSLKTSFTLEENYILYICIYVHVFIHIICICIINIIT